ncbi:hypothetical protein [Geobacter sp.]|uniref:hypothetical protein n=1 Tax=Geobacter sp. TaxID=46610 RepID=UPI0027B9CA93|nr:hypothetical protein [Geobacter sp.]
MNFQNENSYLTKYTKRITSEYGEDGVIEKILEIIGEGDKWCVEFGAGDGKSGSNSWNLITNRGWSGVLIEASDNLYNKLCYEYKDNKNVIALNRMVGFESPDKLDDIFAETPMPTSFELLSIDIDGNDYHVWESVRLYSPKLVVIEFNPTIPNDIEFVQPRDMQVNQGSSLLSLTKLGKEKGYELVAALDCNAFFVKKELFGLFNIQDNSPHAVRKVTKCWETRMFQLYDGILVLDGCKRLIWHGIDIDQEKIQPLPKFLRRYKAELKHPLSFRLFFEFFENKPVATVLLDKISKVLRKIR